MSDSETQPLQILISGAGIGGLTAAIALRQAGHSVTLFEKSRFLNELGAAIHLAPNANGLVRRLGLIPEMKGGIKTEWIAEYKSDGSLAFEMDASRIADRYPHPWQLMHRVDLHSALKERAIAKEGKGVPAIITTSSQVVGVDFEKNELILKDGERYSGDVIIGADGVHSALRSAVLGENTPALPSGQSAFRFLIPVSEILVDPVTAPFVAKTGMLQVWMADDKRIVIYPCRYNLLLNFVCCHPDTVNSSNTEDWSQDASKAELLDMYKDFSPAMIALLSKVPANEIKLWQLLDLPALPTWVKGNVALMGDAAHPFLPYQAQGGAQAIEDGVALAAVLPLGTKREDVADRLKLYQECRYERATRVQDVTRMLGLDPARSKKDLNVVQFTEYNYNHDAYVSACERLEQSLKKE
ncbi:FAD/NAD(P)-binding domain-containing protein [Choiromyces venosus 120613-1]|uniref:FAD/NAD(P)-binding domain-containing protein n=1 Tax=Choiromyces venosus 120613-1 TaxID=1336337 RepID=A0A3N4K1N4_9PEZI|nr:FAD/NAD(P)-binding domain-containing protein [Choiromyces venosus 120613-1]